MSKKYSSDFATMVSHPRPGDEVVISGIHQKDVASLNPATRILLEKVIESIFDAGMNPVELAGTKTGIFYAYSVNEIEAEWYYNKLASGYQAIVGNEKSLSVNKVSHFLRLQGVCRVMDTACNSGMYAVDEAFRSIRMGESDMAIVVGANLCLHPLATLRFVRLGALATDGCKVFDEESNGYTRSEAVVSYILQKAKDCKRIYAQIIHTKSSSDGYKEQGITYPSGTDQRLLLKDVYSECGVNPADISYLEAHGTGTIVGDPEELNSAAEFFCKFRKTPLLVGSIKSNLGNTETASGLCSIAKVLLVLETGVVTPNLHFHSPRKTIPPLHDGRMKVATENTPLDGNNGLIGINSFGFGGCNTHMILKWNTKLKQNNQNTTDNLSRLVCVSGRSEKAIHLLLDDISEKFNYEHIGLIHNIFRKDVPNHIYRGYSVLSSNGEAKRSLSFSPNVNNSVLCFIYFGKMTEPLRNLVPELLKLPILNNLNEMLKDSLLSFDNVLVTYAIVIEVIKQLEIPAIFLIETAFKELDGYFDQMLRIGKYLGHNYIVAKGAENLINFQTNLKNMPVFFCENQSDAFGNIPKKSIILDFGTSEPISNPHQLVPVNCASGLNGFLLALGRLYELGITAQIRKLYPKVEFPVSRGTPMISPKIAWAHDRNQYTVHYKNENGVRESSNKSVKTYEITLDMPQWEFLNGHTIDGKDLFPVSGYLFLAWSALGEAIGIDIDHLRVKFENCKFKGACTVPKCKPSKLELTVMYQEFSAKFEIADSTVPVATGVIKLMDDNEFLDKNVTINRRAEENGIKCLSSRDIYKELRLRGYQYKGLFRAVEQFNEREGNGKINWVGNWITFMNAMLQSHILSKDTRLLYVPTGIRELIIDPTLHYEYVNKLKNASKTELRVDLSYQTIRCGGVKIRGVETTSILRQECPQSPVFEKYEFVPNEGDLNVATAMRVLLQIALENKVGFNLKIAELVEDINMENVKTLSPLIKAALDDQPSAHLDTTLLTLKQDKKLFQQNDYNIVIALNLSQRPTVLNEALEATVNNGYIISRESSEWNPSIFKLKNLAIYNVYSDNKEQFVFAGKVVQPTKNLNTIYLKISETDKEFTWLTKLQNVIKTDSEVVVYAENEPLNGILGLINCIKRQPNYENIRMVFIMDKFINFDPSDELFISQLKKGMAINVLKDKKWGTYRHLLLSFSNSVKTKQCYVNTIVKGDLSSNKWIEGYLSDKRLLETKDTIIKIHYSALNFRDIMIASGRFNSDINTHDRKKEESFQGLEFSGKTTSGKRVMGMVSQGALATLVKADDSLLWNVPENWSLEKAATVPVAYATCLLALVDVGQIKPKSSVLIHSGTEDIGQAAINLCLYIGCTIFTTVNTQEKRDFIRKTYPQIDDSHIGNSRDLSFQMQILKATKGKGVDLVLSSLTEEKLSSSTHCVAKNGKLLKIGKHDLPNGNEMSLVAFQRGISYHGVMLDTLFSKSSKVKKCFNDLLQSYIDSGAVKPLTTNVFDQNEIEKAYRFMSTEEHMGKVLIRIRKENENEADLEFDAIPRFIVNPNSSYILCGGLGGFGLELADWMILRGAKNLILVSRRGITTGYQSYRISLWKSYGCKILISTEDITSKSGCKVLLQTANLLAPVEGIFNLANVLQDAALENQNPHSFKSSMGPKALATLHLDELSRKLCPELKEFVVFSTISCGRGNAFQTNYGLSNSVMERICELRRSEGLPALAIQWGPIGDVGIVAELQEDHIEVAMYGTLQQSVANCLECMDMLLRQKETAVVSCFLVAEKKLIKKSENICDAVMEIIGIKDIKTVSQHSTLAELGMDSMNVVEVKHTLEKDFGIFLTPPEIRNLSFTGLKELEESSSEGASSAKDQ